MVLFSTVQVLCVNIKVMNCWVQPPSCSYHSNVMYLTSSFPSPFLLSLFPFQHIYILLFFPLLGALPSSAPIFPFPPSPTDCVEAHRVCSVDPRCEALYRGLELCAADAAVSPLGEQAAAECLERQDALLAKHPSLLACKCQRGFRREEQCLRIYWRVRLLPGQSQLWGGVQGMVNAGLYHIQNVVEMLNVNIANN